MRTCPVRNTQKGLLSRLVKTFPMIVLLFSLSACSASSVETAVPTSTPPILIETPGLSEQDLKLREIQDIFSANPHKSKFTCGKCHSIDDNEAISGNLTWTDEKTGQSEKINYPSQICTKCHKLHTPQEIQHDSIQLAHNIYECTDCHNPHSTQASCTESQCHSEIGKTINAMIDVPPNHVSMSDPNAAMCGGSSCHELAKEVANTPIYHQPVHRDVPCYVCHDISGMQVSRNEKSSWITIDQVDIETGENNDGFVSHTIGLNADCSRCHFEDNPWGLSAFEPDR